MKKIEKSWDHPGGKLRELGAETLSEAELLSILIGTGTKLKSAEDIAEDILRKFGSYRGMANQPYEKFLSYEGIGEVKLTRIAAAFEIARRVATDVLKDHDK